MKRLTIINVGNNEFDFEEPKQENNPESNENPTLKFTKDIPNPKETITVDREILEMLIKERKGGDGNVSDKLESLISSFKDSLEASTEGRRYIGQRPVDTTEVDPDDILETPRVYFAHSVSFAIYDDIRKKRPVKTPYGRPIKFKKIERTVVSSAGRNPVYTSISAAIVFSKKEAKFLDEHTLFGIKFFERRNAAKDITAELQEELVTQWNIVSSFDEATVIHRCQQLGIIVDSTDFSVMRRKLATNMAKASLERKKKQVSKNAEEYKRFMENDIPESSLAGGQKGSIY